MVGTLYAYLTYRSAVRRTVFIVLAAAVPLVANWVRAYLTAMIGHVFGNEYSVGLAHILYGWVFFGVVVAILFTIGSFWREDNASLIRARPLDGSWPPRNGHRSVRGMLVLAASAVLFVAGAWRSLDAAMQSEINDRRVALLPLEATNGWHRLETPITDWRPRYIGQSGEIHQTFVSSQGAIGVYIAYYVRLAQDRELISSGNTLVRADDVRWKQTALGSANLDSADASLKARSAELAGANGSRLEVLQWYWIGGWFTANPYFAKVLLAWSKLHGGDGDSAGGNSLYAKTGKR
jgi:EpsI family protein